MEEQETKTPLTLKYENGKDLESSDEKSCGSYMMHSQLLEGVKCES
jgi:hypothetical protein